MNRIHMYNKTSSITTGAQLKGSGDGIMEMGSFRSNCSLNSVSTAYCVALGKGLTFLEPQFPSL